MHTLLLDTVAWDLTLDINGNIAVASNPYSLAQDAASECRLFAGEAYYATNRGIPYWGQILGQDPPLALVRAYMLDAAESVPEVVSAQVYFSSWSYLTRRLSGQVQVTNVTGTTVMAAF
jgi:hypothetical protein